MDYVLACVFKSALDHKKQTERNSQDFIYNEKKVMLNCVFPAVHPDLHSDPVQTDHLQRLHLSRLVLGYWLCHGSVLSHLHTYLRPVQDLKVPRSHF